MNIITVSENRSLIDTVGCSSDFFSSEYGNNSVTFIVGKSGVGKSFLINKFVSDKNIIDGSLIRNNIVDFNIKEFEGNIADDSKFLAIDETEYLNDDAVTQAIKFSKENHISLIISAQNLETAKRVFDLCPNILGDFITIEIFRTGSSNDISWTALDMLDVTNYQ